MLVWRERQQIMMAGARAQAQAALGGDKALEAFTEFRDLVHRKDKEERQEKLQKAMEEVKKIREIRFRPMVPTQKPIRLRTVERAAAPKSVSSLRPLPQELPQRARPQRSRR